MLPPLIKPPSFSFMVIYFTLGILAELLIIGWVLRWIARWTAQ